MRHRVWFTALVVLAASCGTPTVVGADPLHEWCRSATPEDCYQGALAIAAGLDPSCLAFGPTYQDVVSGCADDQPPVTTIPGSTSSTEVDTPANERTAELALIGPIPTADLSWPENSSIRCPLPKPLHWQVLWVGSWWPGGEPMRSA